MSTQAELGFNRTGIATSPKLSAEMVQGTTEFTSTFDGDGASIAAVREEYARSGEKVGSVPPPLTLGGVASAAVQGIRGTHPVEFLDKIGARLGFERTGVRLYEALISKFESSGGFTGGPTRRELEEIMHEEYLHFALLVDTITKLGGDPTVVTPSADVAATLSRGILDVLVDPRTTFVQSLEAILAAELVDNDAWEMLILGARQRGDDELTARFESARADEDKHLARVRAWLTAAQGRPVGA
ncbi:MAG TPA: ferritin-like domain-containing protein [Polyangiaceae bacterium]|nr:ferritin-like domain-containing protein [Polyangiaceae bacterium]